MKTNTDTEQKAILAKVVSIRASIEEAKSIHAEFLSKVNVYKDSISESEWRIPSGPALIGNRWE